MFGPPALSGVFSSLFQSLIFRVFSSLMLLFCRWRSVWTMVNTQSMETACWRTDPHPTWRSCTSSSATASFGQAWGQTADMEIWCYESNTQQSIEWSAFLLLLFLSEMRSTVRSVSSWPRIPLKAVTLAAGSSCLCVSAASLLQRSLWRWRALPFLFICPSLCFGSPCLTTDLLLSCDWCICDISTQMNSLIMSGWCSGTESEHLNVFIEPSETETLILKLFCFFVLPLSKLHDGFSRLFNFTAF